MAVMPPPSFDSAREVEVALEMELADGLYGRNWKTEDAGKVASNRLVKARERKSGPIHGGKRGRWSP